MATSLFAKLNLGEAKEILVLNGPESFLTLAKGLEGVRFHTKLATGKTVPFAIGFAVTHAELDDVSTKLVQATTGDGLLWVAYPKGTSKKYRCEFNRDAGWEVLGAAGLEPVRQVAIDEDWSALRFRRVEFIKKLTRNASMIISPEGKARVESPTQKVAKPSASKPVRKRKPSG